MKIIVKISAVLAIASIALFATGCADGNQLVEVRILEVKREYNKGFFEPYPYTMVERTDTGERIKLKSYHWGNTNDVFKIKLKNLHW